MSSPRAKSPRDISAPLGRSWANFHAQRPLHRLGAPSAVRTDRESVSLPHFHVLSRSRRAPDALRSIPLLVGTARCARLVSTRRLPRRPATAARRSGARLRDHAHGRAADRTHSLAHASALFRLLVQPRQLLLLFR